MSMAAAATATQSPWVPLWAAAIGAGAAVAVGVVTQWFTGRRQKQQWDNERKDRQQQWERERQTREEQWQREDSQRWQQDRQQVYARLMAALDEWDRAAISVTTELKLAARIGEDADVDVDEMKRLDTAARQASALVQLMAPETVRSRAESAIRDRQAYRFSMAPKIVRLSGDDPSDFTELDEQWGRVRGGTAHLREAMRDDLGIKSAPTLTVRAAGRTTPTGTPAPDRRP